MGSIPTGPSIVIMRGHSYPLAIKKYCLKHRQKGLSLNELVQIFKIPKSTIHDWVSDQPLSNRAMINIRSKIILGQKRGIEIARKISTKVIPQPDYWTPGLTSIVAHFLFDGYPTSKKDGFVYCGRNLSQIQRMSKLIKNVFGLESHYRKNENEVIKSTNFSVNLYKYISRKKKELLQILPKAPIEIKLAFLKAFFDDEGCVTFNQKVKKVRGFQHSKMILRLVQQLLNDFDIINRIDNNYIEITITGRENLVKFQNLINFSPQIYINPKRKNGLWKQKIEKRAILEKALASYKI